MIDPRDITIIIPHLGKTLEQRLSLMKCWSSLEETVPNVDKIVIFNGEEPFNYKTWQKLKNTEKIYIPVQGQCRSINAAAATVDTKWIFVTNDDMIYAPGWLESVSKMAGTSQFCISPNLVEPQDGAPPFLKHFCGGAGGDFDKAKWLEFAKNHNDVNLETGFNLPFLIRKDLWDLIGGYDINYDPWGSNGDSDLQAKIALAGASTVRDRSTIVYHFSQTSGTFHPDQREYWQRNWDYFIKKWGFERQGDDQKVWYSKELIDYERLQYHPWWEGMYANRALSMGQLSIN